MAILYVLSVNHSDILFFPPSIGDQFLSATEYFEKNPNSSFFNTTNDKTIMGVVLSDLDALGAWFELYSIKDEEIKNNINEWHTAYNLSYSSLYYTVPDNITDDYFSWYSTLDHNSGIQINGLF